MSLGFDRDRRRRQREMTSNRKIKSKFHVTFMLEDMFGFPEHNEKATFGLGYKLTLIRNTHNSVLSKDNAINNIKIKINSIECYVQL